jgi:hypothetical protein
MDPATTHQQSETPRIASLPVIADSIDVTRSEQARNYRPRFEYQALPHPDSIRLVKIRSVLPEIECEISPVRISESPSFEALSYCWGPPGEEVPVICNARLFHVSATLRDGLRQLFRYCKSSKTVWLWIDQICINQKDGFERTQQVRLMNQIYRQSIRTIIWLPLEAPMAITAKSVILERSRYYEARGQLDTEHNGEEDVVIKAKYNKLALSPPSWDDESWHALVSLFDLPWFDRVWVIQEVALSTCPPIVLCGTELIPWSDMQRVAQGMKELPAELGHIARAQFANNIRIIGQKVVWRDGTSDITWDIQTLLILTERFLATNPRDRIFALLGLRKDRHTTSREVAERIESRV